MTDRSSEERSRFEKWATREDVDIGIGKDAAGNYYARVTAKAWLSWRAALEDRQEAAPICQFCHVEMKHQPSCLVDEPVFTCDNPSCKAPQYVSGVPSEAANDRQEAAPTNELHKEHCPECDNDWNCYCTNGPVGIVVCPDCESSETSEKERLLAQEWGTETASPGVPSEADTAKFDRAEKEVARGEVHKLSELSGVPSEATPSKENAPPNDEDRAKFLVMSLDLHKHGMGRDFGDAIRSYHSTKLHAWFDLGNKLNSAPAPEVQGTPKIEDAIEAQLAEIAAHPASGFFQQNAPVGTPRRTIIGFTYETRNKTFEMDEEMYKLLEGYARQGKKLEAFLEGLAAGRILEVAPVGTPQKETPPMKITCKDHDVLDCAICYPTSVSFRVCPTCGCEKYHGPGINCVPEGVQGKEPPTFDEFWAVKQPFDGDSPVGAKFWARKSWAAGRRSAITEIKEWLENDNDEIPHDQGCCAALNVVHAKCAELQEKP